MNDVYNGPTLALLSILVAVFAALYLRSRTQRRLLWLLGWSITALRLSLQISNFGSHGLGLAISYLCLELGPLMFLASMSTNSAVRSGTFKWIAIFTIPMAVYISMHVLVPHQGAAVHFTAVASVIALEAIAITWTVRCKVFPVGLRMFFSIVAAPVCLYMAWTGEAMRLLSLIHSAICLVAALLVLITYRRISPGVVFTATGLITWGLPFFVMSAIPSSSPRLALFISLLNIAKAVTAIGMVVLVLEDEIRVNEIAQKRDRRARAEMEQYSKLFLAATPNRDFGIQYQMICDVITRASRFSRAAILLRNVEQTFQVFGSSGMEPSLAQALSAFARCLTARTMDENCRATSTALPQSMTRVFDLRGMDGNAEALRSLGVDSIYAIPIRSASDIVQGAVFLHGLRWPSEPLEGEDLLPLELLVSRLMAAHENNMLLRRVVQSEKMAGLGQLTGGVAHELNNPLTVVMGYAELIAEGGTDEVTRDYASVIRREAHRMRQTIESLARFWKASPDELASISVEQMLRDIEQLRRPEFERAGITLLLTVADGLPRIRANGDQMRQVLLQVLNNATAALKNTPANQPKQVRIDARLGQDKVQVLVRDSGPGFSDINRVFDPFFTTKAPGEGTGLGLSLCYSIIREHGGEIVLSNLQPHGAAVSIEIPIDKTTDTVFAS
ncbi:sensor histidine kinase [Silvibacterium acidisoli]|uniref:sensor histidine kinase n=1 Tax=Acidobacteriaceae bacterium ZG23-2 TaxID=2883246 RepID=UPI00406C0109